MSQLNIDIPPDLRSWIDRCVADGLYSSPSEFVRDLLQRHQDDADDVEWVKAKLAEGMASGVLEKDAREVLREIMAEYPANRG